MVMLVIESVIPLIVVFSCSEGTSAPNKVKEASRVPLLPYTVKVHSIDESLPTCFHGAHCEESSGKTSFRQVVGSVDTISHSVKTVGVCVTYKSLVICCPPVSTESLVSELREEFMKR